MAVYICQNQIYAAHTEPNKRKESKAPEPWEGGRFLSSYRKLWLRNWNSLCARYVSMAARSHHIRTASNSLPLSDQSWQFLQGACLGFQRNAEYNVRVLVLCRVCHVLPPLVSIFGLFLFLVKCDYELILVQLCLSRYLWLSCVFIVLSV